MSRADAEAEPLDPFPRLALAAVARAPKRHDRDRRAGYRRHRDDARHLHPAEGLAAVVAARGRRRIRPHHSGVLDRSGGDAGAGPVGRRRRDPDRQGHLGRTRGRPRRRRDGHRARIHAADPPQRDLPAAPENGPQRHDRRGRSGQRQGAHRGRRKNFTLAQTEPNTNLDAFLATLDVDTQQYLQLLLSGGAQGIGGRGKQLGNALRRFQPFVHYTAKLNKAVAQRHVALADAIHSFASLTHRARPPRRRDQALRHLVGRGARQLRQPAERDPGDRCRSSRRRCARPNAGLASSNRFSKVAYPALTALIPQAQALTPAFKATEKLFSQTTAPIRDQIRPFTRQIRPVLTHANEGVGPVEQDRAEASATRSAAFNTFFNELAYKPKGSKESSSSTCPGSTTTSTPAFNLQDAGGPILRGLVMITCTATNLAYGLAERRTSRQDAAEIDRRATAQRTAWNQKKPRARSTRAASADTNGDP